MPRPSLKSMTFADPPNPSMSGASTRWCVGERGDVVLPADLGVDAELAAVQQHDRITLSRFEITGDETVDQHGLALDSVTRFPMRRGRR